MSTPANILVADDDPVARDLLVEVLQAEGYRTVAANGGAESIALARSTPLELALVDLRMPDVDGLQVLRELKSIQPALPVIIITAFADMETAVSAIRAGAYDYLSKPFRMEEIRETVRRTLRASQGQRVGKVPALKAAGGSELLVGRSPAMVAVYKLLARVARNDATVLITGETGTGKEQVARAIHQASPRANAPFVPVDCTALPETLFESELFGHERGAFTGAHAQRQGMLEVADGGTCFIDEIGELSLALQAKLLRTLQEKTTRRLGGNQTFPLRARIVVATNRDLPRLVRQGAFREDLLYRLDVVRINIPPLRERREDIPLLIRHFLEKYASEGSAPLPEISSEAMASLKRYHWPGNVRQLENVIQRLMAVSVSPVVLAEDLPIEVTTGGALAAQDTDAPVRLRDLKKHHILEILEKTGGNKMRAAQMLGIDRRTLYRILERSESAEDKSS